MDFETITAWMNQPIVHIGSTPVTLGGIGAAMTIFVVSLVISSTTRRVLASRLGKNPKFSASMIYALNRILHYVIIIFGIVLAAQTIGFNFGTLAVAFGFLGVGIGLGLQNITANFTAGLLLLIERPVSVGDFVNVEGQIGRVTDIGMRATRIRTLDNIVIIVPNSKFADNSVINWSIEDQRVRLHNPVGVAYGSDVATVRSALEGVAKAHPDVLKNPEPEVRFRGFGDSSLDFELLYWIDEPRKQFLVQSQINYDIDAAFRRDGVTIPFPQRDLHLKMGDAVDLLAQRKDH
ncbi:MAG: mechanosensitive ion channel [Candidatus Omnitrophica bacterium]|nr:mechanosensitive ion channel [Candidatus Omnitrophota bacterium]MCB9720924.1 mechanosensitive ion channel [Candidatus Omnitrophota bacterium]